MRHYRVVSARVCIRCSSLCGEEGCMLGFLNGSSQRCVDREHDMPVQYWGSMPFGLRMSDDQVMPNW